MEDREDSLNRYGTPLDPLDEGKHNLNKFLFFVTKTNTFFR